jgi:hypothetical protein
MEQTDLRTHRTPARLAFADHMNRLVTGNCAPSAPEGAGMLTGADPTLDRPMILFQYVTKGTAPVDVGSSPPEHLGFELHNRRRITGVLVGALELVRAAGRRLVARG